MLVFVSAALLALAGIQYFVTGAHVQQIPYSQFKQLLAEGEVRDLLISAEQVRGTMQAAKGSAEPHPFATNTEAVQRIIILLAGRAAEEMVFGEVTTSAQNDLRRATRSPGPWSRSSE